eukprot:5550416-Pleurochrysis_carterae.AAC.2
MRMNARGAHPPRRSLRHVRRPSATFRRQKTARGRLSWLRRRACAAERRIGSAGTAPGWSGMRSR